MPRPLPTRSDIRAAARGTSARLERRAAFARLSEHDLPVPNADDLLEAPPTAQRLIEVADASESSSEDVLASLAHEGYGIDLAEHPLTQLTCGTDTHTVCVNREFTTSEALAT